jgi:predicted metal-dependent HD superfamily phosphohydrolase
MNSTLQFLKSRWDNNLALVNRADQAKVFTHLKSILYIIDENRLRAQKLALTSGRDLDLTSVIFAAYFHDSVYSTDGAVDNEAASSQLATDLLCKLNVSQQVRDEVKRLIDLTRQHNPSDEDTNGILLIDSDLAILASPTHSYSKYVREVRAEYHCTDEEWKIGRSQVLQHLVRQTTFRLPGSSNMNRVSVENMKRELSQLEGEV